MDGIRPVHSEAVKDICRTIAFDNYGFLYVNDNRNEIQRRYSEDERSDSIVYRGRVSEDALKSELMDLVSDGAGRHIRNSEVFFFSPFTSPQGRSDELIERLERLFEENLYVTEQDLLDWFDHGGDTIAHDDMDILIKELKQREVIEGGIYGTTECYRAGPELEQRSDLASLTDRLENVWDSGVVTHKKLQQELGVDASDDIIRDLVRDGEILDLGSKYLVNTDEALQAYADHLARQCEGTVEREFKDSKNVLPVDEFVVVVENEIQNLSTILSRGEGATIKEYVIQSIESRLSLNDDVYRVEKTENVPGSGREVELILREEEVESFANDRGEQIATQVVQSGKEYVTPGDAMEIAEEHLQEISGGISPEVDEYLRQRVREECRAKLPEKDEILETEA